MSSCCKLHGPQIQEDDGWPSRIVNSSVVVRHWVDYHFSFSGLYRHFVFLSIIVVRIECAWVSVEWESQYSFDYSISSIGGLNPRSFWIHLNSELLSEVDIVSFKLVDFSGLKLLVQTMDSCQLDFLRKGHIFPLCHSLLAQFSWNDVNSYYSYFVHHLGWDENGSSVYI